MPRNSTRATAVFAITEVAVFGLAQTSIYSVGTINIALRIHLKNRAIRICVGRFPKHPIEPGINMLKYLAAYGAMALVILAIDFLWLGFIAKSFYRDSIGHLMADPPNLVAGGIFYLLYPIGILLFAVAPAALSGVEGLASWSRVILAGALFGFFCYATYDLTNLATLRGWPLRFVLVDIALGVTLTTAAAAAGRWALERMS